MFNTAVIVLALIGASLVQAHPPANNPNSTITTQLICNQTSVPEIVLTNEVISSFDLSCRLTADNIRITNCKIFNPPGQSLEIIGQNITLTNNQFYGANITFAIGVRKNIVLANNTFNGDKQLHQLVGEHVSLTSNSYHGEQTHNITAEFLNKINNTYVGTEQTHQIKVENLLETESHYEGKQTHTLVADTITLTNNQYFGSPQIHEIEGNSLYRAENEFYGCGQWHNTEAKLMFDYSTHYIGCLLWIGQQADSGMLKERGIIEVPEEMCGGLTPLGLKFNNFYYSDDPKIRRSKITTEHLNNWEDFIFPEEQVWMDKYRSRESDI